MSTAATPRLTPNDLLEMDDEGKGFELVDGELEELVVSKESSRIAGNICTQIKNHVNLTDSAWVFPEGTSYSCFADDRDRVRRPDTSVILLERMPPSTYEDEGNIATVPDLVVEVISIHDNASKVEDKIEQWLAAGVKLLWEVYPNTRTIRADRPDGTITLFRSSDTLTAEGVLPEFACQMIDLFRLPGESPIPS